MRLLLEADYDTQNYNGDLKHLLFLAFFVLAVIGVAVWWLRR